MLKILMTLALLMAAPSWAGTGLSCEGSRAWTAWTQFRQHFITPEGRVVDHSDHRKITTSEGQSYALFFALVDNDPALFWRVLRWTEKHLANGDLTSHLPSWLWGRDEDGQWQVLDTNSASDSDLWIAYSLLEAGRLWGQHSYTVLGTLMLQRMASEEIISVPELGVMLLPGRRGFVHDDTWRFNPSYLPPQLVLRASEATRDEVWKELAANTDRLLMSSSPLGVAPDWMTWTEQDSGGAWATRFDGDGVGGYDAIRVYLWVGMMDAQAEHASALKSHFMKIDRFLSEDGSPPETINTTTGEKRGQSPTGFSAALLPLFHQSPVGDQQRERLKTSEHRQGGYYGSVLSLFGQAWDEQRYRFDAQGYVVPKWAVCE